MKRTLIAAAAGVHLAIAALYSTHVQVENLLPAFIERPLRIYGDFSGAHTHFNFFAPAVSSQARADFLVTMRDGSTRRARLNTDNFEANQRLAMMFTFFGNPQSRVPLMRAWAWYFLLQHPESVSAETRVEFLDIPSLEKLRAGEASRWVEVGRATVTRAEFEASGEKR